MALGLTPYQIIEKGTHNLNIANYIMHNLLKWAENKLNPKNYNSDK